MNKFYYMTQYDDAGMYDSDVIHYLEENTKEISEEQLQMLMKLVPEVDDKYNQVLYNMMMSSKVNSNNIDLIVEVWEELSKGNITNALNVLNIEYQDIMAINDCAMYDSETLEIIADEDLRMNGLTASALYWYKEIEADSIHIFNGYGNGFDVYEDYNDCIEYYFHDFFKELFIEALEG